MMRRVMYGWLAGACLACLFLSLALVQHAPGQEAGKAAWVQIQNGTKDVIEVFWVDGKGVEKSYGVVKPGQTKKQDTFSGHTWVVRNAKKQQLGRFTVDKNKLVLYTVQDVPSALTAKETDEVLQLHNKARKEVGVKPVKWSADLAKYAQEWADELARTGKFEHRPLPLKHGECIAGHYGTVLGAAQLWYDEKKHYTSGTRIPEDILKFKAGHYTQMVWHETTEIGAGKAICQTGKNKGMLILVCCYNPGGNTTGEKPY